MTRFESIILTLTEGYFNGTLENVVATEELVENLFALEKKIAMPFDVILTPSVARYILEHHNINNRKLNQGTVLSYKKQMMEGTWENNGESVTFCSNGALGNGQHRLTACAQSGLAIPFTIVCGVDYKLAMPTFDTGKGRTSGDVISMIMQDCKSQGSAKFMASIIKKWLSYKEGRITEHGAASTRQTAVTNTQVGDYYTNNKESLTEWLKYFSQWKVNLRTDKSIKHPQELCAFAIYAASKGYDTNTIINYFDILTGGQYGTSPLMKSVHDGLSKFADNSLYCGRYQFMNDGFENFAKNNLSVAIKISKK